MLITRQSPITGKSNTLDIPVTAEQIGRWQGPNPPLIQECFPGLTPDEREFILTGTTAEDWEMLFGKDKEE